jgi:hypothetical protein
MLSEGDRYWWLHTQKWELHATVQRVLHLWKLRKALGHRWIVAMRLQLMKSCVGHGLMLREGLMLMWMLMRMMRKPMRVSEWCQVLVLVTVLAVCTASVSLPTSLRLRLSGLEFVVILVVVVLYLGFLLTRKFLVLAIEFLPCSAARSTWTH